MQNKDTPVILKRNWRGCVWIILLLLLLTIGGLLYYIIDTVLLTLDFEEIEQQIGEYLQLPAEDDDSDRTSPSVSETDAPDTQPPETRSWQDNVLLNLPYGNIDTGKLYEEPVVGSDISRSKILSITFLDSQKNAPSGSWDVSEAGDGGVLAWVKANGSGYDLYIAGEGGVAAPEDSADLFRAYQNVQTIAFNGAFHTDFARSMSRMFNDCFALTGLDVSDFNTANVTENTHTARRKKSRLHLEK